MEHKYTFNLDVAQKAYREGALFERVQEYLRGEGWNKGLADHLVEGKPTLVILKEFPLSKLKRIMGPEENLNFQEDSNTWEKRVANLVTVIKEGVELPPLIVTDFWQELELADGSHRHEAFRREGYQKYWTIFFFNKPESRALIE